MLLKIVTVTSNINYSTLIPTLAVVLCGSPIVLHFDSNYHNLQQDVWHLFMTGSGECTVYISHLR